MKPTNQRSMLMRNLFTRAATSQGGDCDLQTNKQFNSWDQCINISFLQHSSRDKGFRNCVTTLGYIRDLQTKRDWLGKISTDQGNKLQSVFEAHSRVFYSQHDKRITMACTNQRINMLMDRFFGEDCYLLMRSLESLAYKERTSKQTTNYACTKGMHTVKSTRLQMIFQM